MRPRPKVNIVRTTAPLESSFLYRLTATDVYGNVLGVLSTDYPASRTKSFRREMQKKLMDAMR